MKIFFTIILNVLLLLTMRAQTVLPLTDDMDLITGQNVKISAGSYTLDDVNEDGLIRISNQSNITIDGDDVFVEGSDYSGYMIRIINSDNITIKNFESARDFFYVVRISNSTNITIKHCNFSYNAVDSSGFISIWTDTTAALGGGVMMNACSHSIVDSCVMQYQNDGVALYHCDNIEVAHSLFSWNTSYGVRMYYSDTCHIHHIEAAHVNRPQTDPSDCASLLMLIANENIVEHNDLTYSGDGVFLSQYQKHLIPNNNYFLYNDCSNSPHNAIEATFADGNIYKHNICNNSWFGFWLGYSFNSVVDSNIIMNNQGYSADFGAGIAIDRGFNNQITNNDIMDNANGIKLWHGGNITGYANQTSHDYLIKGNVFRANKIGLYAARTDQLIVKENLFDYYNEDAIVLQEYGNTNDTISNNIFNMATRHFIYNGSSDNIYAENNTFPDDFLLLECKIHDQNDNPNSGIVDYLPYNIGDPPPGYEFYPPADLNEPPSVWDEFTWVQYGYTTNVNYDSVEKQVGDYSVHMLSEGGYDIIMRYHPADYKLMRWDLSEVDTIKFWLKAEIDNPNNPWGFQETFIRLGTSVCGEDPGYIEFKNDANPNVLNPALGTWRLFKIPMQGNALWTKSVAGNVDLSKITYVDFNFDVWDLGVEVWLDGFTFAPLPGISIEQESEQENIVHDFYPNPVENEINIPFDLQNGDHVKIDLFDVVGNHIATIEDRYMGAGEHTIQYMLNDMSQGIYFIRFETKDFSQVKKMIVR